MKYDAIVIGAGPAGATCAYHLSKQGLKVLLVEKQTLPRFKLCAGCLSKRIERELPYGWEKLILNTIYTGTLKYKNKSFSLSSDEPIAHIVDRATFDTFLAQKAQETGAELVIDKFESFSVEDGKYKVQLGNKVLTCDFLIGADGFYSKVAKILGYRKQKFYRSVEFFPNFSVDPKGVEISIGLVKRGYGWKFPKGNYASIGVATTFKENLLEILKIYSGTNGKIYGWHIPYAEDEKDLHLGKDRTLLVGDAGNFVDPLLGEGIYYAVLSAKKAAQAIAESPSNPKKLYKDLTKDLAQEFKYASRIARIGYNFQLFAFVFGKIGGLRLYYQFLRGEISYKELYKKGLSETFKAPFKLISRG